MLKSTLDEHFFSVWLLNISAVQFEIGRKKEGTSSNEFAEILLYHP